jgi:hypothetical protein
MIATMTSERSRYGLFVSSLGAALLAGSLFLPWYAVSVTQAGAGSLGHLGSQLAAHLGTGSLQAYAGGLHGTIAALAGQKVGALTAEQALSALTVVLLVLAGLSLLDALVPLARRTSRVPEGAGGAVVVLGILASGCVLYRMIAPPTPAGELVALSLREGAWLALLGSLMVALGGMWPRSLPAISTAEAFGGDIWASLTSGTGAGS